jgi:A/G-specific adenine glycosylase
LAYEVMSKDDPATFNQAIMEFGALQCVPKNPNCSACIFNSSCAALQKKKVAQLPIKSKKVKVTRRYFNYLFFSDENQNTLINKRVGKGIWENLYEFPLIETDTEFEIPEVISLIQKKFGHQYQIRTIFPYNTESIQHKLSHQQLFIRFWNLTVVEIFDNGIPINELVNFPFSKLLSNFIEREL